MDLTDLIWISILLKDSDKMKCNRCNLEFNISKESNQREFQEYKSSGLCKKCQKEVLDGK